MKKRIKEAICFLLCCLLAFFGSTAACAMDTPWVPLTPDTGTGEPTTEQMPETEKTAEPVPQAPAQERERPAQTVAVESAASSEATQKPSGNPGCFGGVHADCIIFLLPLFTAVLMNGKSSHKRVPKSK